MSDAFDISALVGELLKKHARARGLLQRPTHLVELPTLMSNFDRRVDARIATQLQAGDFFAQYAAWNFCGYVWYDRTAEQWHCEIWRHNAHVETLTTDDPEEILRTASEKYGRE